MDPSELNEHTLDHSTAPHEDGHERCFLCEARAAERVRREELTPVLVMLKAVHPPHPQPELCKACRMIGRPPDDAL